MRTLLGLLLLVGTAGAGEYTVQPRYTLPGSPQPGTLLNPYVVRDSAGRQQGTITDRYNGLQGAPDPGTLGNPWVTHGAGDRGLSSFGDSDE